MTYITAHEAVMAYGRGQPVYLVLVLESDGTIGGRFTFDGSTPNAIRLSFRVEPSIDDN